ncbi:MAG: matrixin family metalloprotease [Myxococcota bacterium]
MRKDLAWRTLLSASTALLSSGFTVVRDPTVVAPIKWATPSITLVTQSSGSSDVSDGSDLQAITAALRIWSQVSSSNLVLVDGGVSPTQTLADDGVNRIVFLSSNIPPAAEGIPAFTTRYRNTSTSPHTWSGADIVFNDLDYDWSTNGSLQTFDIQSVATHELGHVLGLMHSADPQATMYFASKRGNTRYRTLFEDDLAAVRYLYPAAGFSCTTSVQCPLMIGLYGGIPVRQSCSAGTCTTGTVAYGGDCLDDSHCDSSICLEDPAMAQVFDPGFCSQDCDINSCPNGDLCAAINSGNRCLYKRDDCWDVDDASNPGVSCPGANTYCVIDLDGYFRCRSTCLQDLHCSEPDDFCIDATDATDPGFCLPPGPVDAGPCDSAFDCQSLLCTPDINGNAMCHSTNAPDGGMPDGGSSTDGNPSGDSASGDPMGDTTIGGSDSQNAGDSDVIGNIRGGCSALSSLPTLSCTSFVMLLTLRRSRRGG